MAEPNSKLLISWMVNQQNLKL